jgi:hypothetical protein
MESLSSRSLRSLLFLFLCALLLPVPILITPGRAQAFGSLTENGTAAFMGIGVTPQKILHVSGTGPGTVPLFVRGTDSAGFIIERTPTNRWVLGVNENPDLGNGFVLSTIPTGTQSVPRLLVTQDGKVGIGNMPSGTIAIPIAKLDVIVQGGTDTAISGSCATGGTGAGVYGYSSLGQGVSGKSGAGGCGGKFTTIGGNIIEGWDTSPNLRFKVDNAGNVSADGTITGGGADFAEMLPAAGTFEPGDVLVIGADGKLALSQQPYTTAVAGVYSTKPGFVGSMGGDEDLTGKIPLAVVGIVPVKASAENGSIIPGDLLSTSNTTGRAMKATEPRLGTIIGKALECLKSGTGTIRMLVTLQ